MVCFTCPNCGKTLSAPDECAGRIVQCRGCNNPLTVPAIAAFRSLQAPPTSEATPVLSVARPRMQSQMEERTAKRHGAAEMAAPLAALVLALVIAGFSAWFLWSIPSPTPPPEEQQSQREEQLASLDPRIPLPLLQPEVESPPRDVAAPTPSRLPPPPAPPAAKNRPADPPPEINSRPPDLPSPPRPAKDVPKKETTASSKDRSEAELLGNELVKAASEQQDRLLEKLRQGKGTEYTEALVTAIGRLDGEAKEKSRQTLVDRLTRFTPATLVGYLGNESPELRRAAAMALGIKGDKDHVSELIDLLDDPAPSVVAAADTALKKLTNRDPASSSKAAPKEQANARPNQKSESQTPMLPSEQPKGAVAPKPPPMERQASRKTQKKDDVPEVALVPPPETSSDVKAIIRSQAIALHSKKASERIQAAQVLGGLGEEGKPARRLLCAAMLDPVATVRVAAADALKNIDPKMQYLAVMLALEKVADESDAARVATLLGKIEKLEEDGEPLIPLVANVLKFAAGNDAHALLVRAVTTLSHIGQKDLASYRVVATALTNQDIAIRAAALRGVARMKHGKLALSRILALLKVDAPANRIIAMETLVVLADESTEEIIKDAIAEQRYHESEEVRKAVEAALNKLENKQAP